MEIQWSELQAIIAEMNESGLTKKLTPKKTETIINDFMKNVETVPEDREEEIPLNVVNFYNMLVEAIENDGESLLVVDEKEDELPEEKEEKPASKPKKKKDKKKVKKEIEKDEDEDEDPEAEEMKKHKDKKGKKIADVSSKKEKARNEYGATEGSGTYKIDEMLAKGTTIDEIAEEVKTPNARVRNRVASLKKKGVEFHIEKKDDKNIYKIKK